METKTIDLKPFCMQEQSGRYDLTKPFKSGDWIVATDGKIMVRCKPEWYSGELAADDAKVVTQSGIAPIMKSIDAVKEWLPLPEFPACEKCEWTGKITIDCDQCRGLGTCTCDCGDEHDCGTCDGEGEWDTMCEDCICLFGEHKIQRQVYIPIAALPGVMWGDTGKKNAALFFKWDGGDGAFMPMEKAGQ